MAEAWAPDLVDVARHVPTRTRDTKNPGSDLLLNTFTASTTPTGDQAQGHIDNAVTMVLSQTGPLDQNDAGLTAQARTVVEWRAAADIELAYPNRDADVQLYLSLDARAKYELTMLLRRLQAQNEGTAESVPFWSAPNPPVYADMDPGDYTRPLAVWLGGIDVGDI